MRNILFTILLIFSASHSLAEDSKLCVETKRATFCFEKTEKVTCEVIHHTSEKLCAEIGGIFEEVSTDCFLCY